MIFMLNYLLCRKITNRPNCCTTNFGMSNVNAKFIQNLFRTLEFNTCRQIQIYNVILDFKLSPCSVCCMLSGHPNYSQIQSFITYQPTKMEQTECSETSAYKIQTPGNYPKENIQQYNVFTSCTSKNCVTMLYNLEKQHSVACHYNTYRTISTTFPRNTAPYVTNIANTLTGKTFPLVLIISIQQVHKIFRIPHEKLSQYYFK